jgi:hypothetical protein
MIETITLDAWSGQNMLIYWQTNPRVKSYRPNSLGLGKPSGLPQTIDHGLAGLNNKSEFFWGEAFPLTVIPSNEINFPAAS